MPIQSPALLDSPANLLSSRSTGIASSFGAKSGGAKALFASVLSAQNSRPSLAEIARHAQSTPRSSPSANAATSQSSKLARPAHGSKLEPAGRAHDAKKADRAERAKHSDDEHAQDVETRTDAPVDVHDKSSQTSVSAADTNTQPGRDGADEGDETPSKGADVTSDSAGAVASLIVSATESVARIKSAADASASPSEDANSKAAIANTQRSSAAPLVKEQALSAKQTSAEAAPAKGSETQEDEQAAARRAQKTSAEGATKAVKTPSGQPQASATQVQDAQDDAAKNAGKRDTTDTFRQSAANGAQAPDENKPKPSPRTNANVASTQPGVVENAKQSGKETAIQEATRREIDAIINGEKSSGNAKATNTQRDAQAAAPMQADGSTAATHAQTTSTAPHAGSSPALELAPPLTLAGSSGLTLSATAAPTLGATSFTGDAAAQNASNAGSADWMTRSDHAAGRILRGLSAMINQNGGSMTMRLDPPDLGSLRIQMTISNGSVSASFAPTSAAAHGLLEQNMAQLRTALESQGLLVDRLSIQPNQPGQTNAHAGHQHGTDGRSAHDQSSQFADAGHGESRGRSEHDGSQQRSTREFFDPSTMFDMNDATEFSLRSPQRSETRIPA